MKTSEFDYELPRDRIAQRPAPERDGARLLALERDGGAVRHLRFTDLPGLLRPGDLVVVNDTRVLPARLFATVRSGALATVSGGGPDAERSSGSAAHDGREVEVFLLREEPAVAPERVWMTLGRPARALAPGVSLSFVDPAYGATVISAAERGVRRVSFRPARDGVPPFETWLSRVGHVPLPPYIDRPDEPEDRERYQTVFAREPGSVAAPTAGLHFTDATLQALRAARVGLATVTLHVGPGTFRPVATEDPADHVLDPEPYRVPPETAAAIRMCRVVGGRVIAVGTTCVRTLEAWVRGGEALDGAWRETSLLIYPPFEFRVVGGLLTNFHLPRSSLLMLVAAFAGRGTTLRAYAEAVREGYRFYSYGDAMWIA